MNNCQKSCLLILTTPESETRSRFWRRGSSDGTCATHNASQCDDNVCDIINDLRGFLRILSFQHHCHQMFQVRNEDSKPVQKNSFFISRKFIFPLIVLIRIAKDRRRRATTYLLSKKLKFLTEKILWEFYKANLYKTFYKIRYYIVSI